MNLNTFLNCINRQAPKDNFFLPFPSKKEMKDMGLILGSACIALNVLANTVFIGNKVIDKVVDVINNAGNKKNKKQVFATTRGLEENGYDISQGAATLDKDGKPVFVGVRKKTQTKETRLEKALRSMEEHGFDMSHAAATFDKNGNISFVGAKLKNKKTEQPEPPEILKKYKATNKTDVNISVTNEVLKKKMADR